MNVDLIIENVNLATMSQTLAEPYGAIYKGAIAINNGKIAWLGPMTHIPMMTVANRLNGHGQWLTPGLIDCHTHLIYGGNRAQEFEARLNGATYEEIARLGGGINSTVASTRQSSVEKLLAEASQRLKKLTAEGVTTIEIKSGYGLNLTNELKMLQVMQLLDDRFPQHIEKTYLAAHALPPEYHGDSDAYITAVCSDMLPKIADLNLAQAVDVFCEHIGFTSNQCRKIFTQAQSLGMRIKGHVEQLSYQGGAALVAEFGGLSVDHVEYLPEKDLHRLKENHVVAVILPTAFYYLSESQKPPIQAMREAGIDMAIATDHNPGSSPTLSLLTTMNQAAIQFGMTTEETLAGTTRHAAKALGLEASKGQLQAGFDADLVLWPINHPSELSYGINMNTPSHIWIGGQHV